MTSAWYEYIHFPVKGKFPEGYFVFQVSSETGFPLIDKFWGKTVYKNYKCYDVNMNVYAIS